MNGRTRVAEEMDSQILSLGGPIPEPTPGGAGIHRNKKDRSGLGLG